MSTSHRRRRRIAAAAVSLAGLAALTGCGTDLDTAAGATVDTPDAVVIVAGAHANVPAPEVPVAFRDMISAAIGAEAPLTVITLDGRPSVSFRAAGYTISTENPDAAAIDTGRVEADVVGAVHEATPDDDGSDLGEALSIAADQVRADGASRPAIIVIDSGLSDRGFPDMTAEGATLADPAAAVDLARRSGETWSIPSGTTVYLVGIGYTAPPQEPLPGRQRDSVARIWSALLLDAGAAVENVTVARTGESRSASFRTGTVTPAESAAFVLQRSGETVRADLSADVLFDFASDRLREDALPALSRLLEVVAGTPGDVTVIGHTDAVGSAEDNLALSEARARSVADFLIANGVDASRIAVEGRGESEPVVPDATDPADQQANRRVVVEIDPA